MRSNRVLPAQKAGVARRDLVPTDPLEASMPVMKLAVDPKIMLHLYTYLNFIIGFFCK